MTRAERGAPAASRDPVSRLARNARTWWLPLALLALTALKLVLVSGQELTALGGAWNDDGLFVRSAWYILQGAWLGPYDVYTLAKGPGYPLWIAFASLLGLRLLVAQHALLAMSAGLVAWVTRPIARSRWVAPALYVALLFDPASFTAGAGTRIVRESFYSSVTLIVLACAIALWIRGSRRPAAWAGWALALGVSGALYWVTREEGVWIAPLVILPLSSLVFIKRPIDKDPRVMARTLLPWGVALLTGWLVVASFGLQNYRVYGVWRITDVQSAPFLNAYGALTRVEHSDWVRDVPVPRDVREKVYRVSPAFAELRPSLEGSSGATWIAHGGGTDIRGGWFMWALRGVAAEMGYHVLPVGADLYYQRLADEVNEACDDGRLPSGPRRASLMPPLRTEYIKPTIDAAVTSLKVIATYPGFTPESDPSSVPPEVWQHFSETVKGDFAGYADPSRAKILARSILAVVILPYRWLMPLALLASVAGTALAFRTATSREADGRDRATAAFMAMLVLLLAARIALVSLVDATSFDAVTSGYLRPAYALEIIWATFGVWIVVETVMPVLRDRVARRRAERAR